MNSMAVSAKPRCIAFVLALLAALVLAVALSGTRRVSASEEKSNMTTFKLTSPSFKNNDPIPTKYTCDGQDSSPPLHWEGAPEGTKRFALIVDDPDAPVGTFTHWLLYGVPANKTELPENVSHTDRVAALDDAKQGMNDYGKIGYGGPCPPHGHGVHHYRFKLFALDAELQVPPRETCLKLNDAMKGHILAQTELVGIYQRK
jgi:Raf kinase inhibitor-like YbhB/YbcL family protein